MTLISFCPLAGGSSRKPCRHRKFRLEAGFSLIEALISMLVLALGVIGAVGMQLAALRTTQQSAYQTAALQIASDIADTIHAWRLHTDAAGGEKIFPQIDYNSAEGLAPVAPAVSCYATDCDAQALIEFEVYEWKQRITSLLPNGRVLICYDSEPWDATSKALRWACSGGPGGPLVVKIGWQVRNPDGSLVRDLDGTVPPSVALPVLPA